MKKLGTFFLLVFLIGSATAKDGKALFESYSCASCHDPVQRLVGPSLLEIAKKYGNSEKAINTVANLIIHPNPANWPGFAYMPPFDIPFENAKALAKYILVEVPKEAKALKKQQKETIELDEIDQFH
jgi:cytochrome c551/c552